MGNAQALQAIAVGMSLRRPTCKSALALTFAQPVAPAEVEEEDEDEEFGRFSGSSNSGWM